MTATSIHELHENTALWVSKAIMHKLYGGTDSTQIISEMRDGR